MAGRFTPPRPKASKVWAASEMSFAEATANLQLCDCPAIITVSGLDTIVEHIHRSDCSVLVEWKKANRG